ncbi:MAG: hemerythrin [Oscillatoriales cyanobacterium]|nr:MAG: hemerythrin [Oscillatoriales cyanobacterium]
METGIPDIDAQHKQLIDKMNELIKAIQSNQDQATIQRIVSSLSSIANLHFGYEETCMNRYRCPIAEKNKMLHSLFTRNFSEIRRELLLSGSSPELKTRIEKDLLDWFGTHIKGIDTQLKSCMD